MKNFKRTALLLAVCCSVLLVAGCSSPIQGAGALYIIEKGKIKCLEVNSVTFWASRHTEYTMNGKGYIVQVALDYYPGQICN